MTRRRGWTILILLVPLLVWSIDQSCMILWVGGTNVDLVFVVVERGSGKPVSDAGIEVEHRQGITILTTGSHGVSNYLRREVTCCGAKSRLGFTDTHAVSIPHWRFRVRANGYKLQKWMLLNGTWPPAQLKKISRSQSLVVVQVSLVRENE